MVPRSSLESGIDFSLDALPKVQVDLVGKAIKTTAETITRTDLLYLPLLPDPDSVNNIQ